MKAKKWKKRDRKFNNNKFSYKVGQKNLSKSTKMLKTRFRFSVIEIIHAKAKTWVFPTSFVVILSAVALPVVLKAEFNIEQIMYITIFFF